MATPTGKTTKTSRDLSAEVAFLTGKPSRGRANGTASAAWVGGAGWGRADWATAGDPGRG